MIFQNTPHAFNRVIFAMIRGIIGQFQVDILRSGKVHQTLDELRSAALSFRSIIHIQDEGMGPKSSAQLRPEALQAIHNEIGSHDTVCKIEPHIIGGRQQHPKQLQGCLRGEIMIAGDHMSAIPAPTGIGTESNRGLGVQREAEIARRRVSKGIQAVELGEDGVRLRNLFLGLLFTTFRGR